jgi:hypothetical protein
VQRDGWERSLACHAASTDNHSLAEGNVSSARRDGRAPPTNLCIAPTARHHSKRSYAGTSGQNLAGRRGRRLVVSNRASAACLRRQARRGGMLSFPKRQTRRTRRLGRRARDGARRTGLPPGLTSHWARPLSVVHPSSPHFLSFPAAATTEASAGGGTPRLSAIAPRPDGAPACIAAVRRSGVIAAASAHVACASASWRLPTRASA